MIVLGTLAWLLSGFIAAMGDYAYVKGMWPSIFKPVPQSIQACMLIPAGPFYLLAITLLTGFEYGLKIPFRR